MMDVQLRTTGSAVIGIVLVVLCGNGAAATQLQWKLAKGKTYYQKTGVDQQITQSLMGQEQKMEMAMGTGLKLQVLDVDAQGNMRIQYTYLWSKLRQVNPMGQVDYDSSRQSPVPAGAEGFAALVGQSYTVKLTPKGKVLDVNGVEQLRETVLKRLPAGADTSMGMNPVAMYIDKTTVKQMTEANMNIYPDKPVSPGESWTREMTVAIGFAMIIQSKWTLQKEEAGVATMSLAATVRTDPSAPPMDAGGMKVKANMKGTQEGTIQVVEATGLITTSKEHQLLKGELQIGTPGDSQSTMTIPMTIDSQVTSETGEQMWKTGP